MKQALDKFTSDMFGSRCGRPNKLKILSGVERMRLYRKRQQEAQREPFALDFLLVCTGQPSDYKK